MAGPGSLGWVILSSPSNAIKVLVIGSTSCAVAGQADERVMIDAGAIEMSLSDAQLANIKTALGLTLI